MKELTLYLDQYGQRYTARTVKELADKVSGYLHPRVSKMYQDDNKGRSYHTGYVINGLWLSAYRPLKRSA